MDIKRKIIIEKDIDQNLCIKVDELKALFDYYPPCNPHRLGFMIMATLGLRPSEVCSLHITNILNDFKYIKYTVKKPVNRFYADTGTLITTYKNRTREIKYSTLRYELKRYCLMNYQTFKDGKLFKYKEAMFRKELCNIRKKILSNKLISKEWQGFLDPAMQTIWAEDNDYFKQKYRITPYSCRRFYNTYKLWCEYGGNIILSTRDLGHNHIDTNMIYSYSPDKIGISEQDISSKKTFDNLFSSKFQGQISLNEFC